MEGKISLETLQLVGDVDVRNYAPTLREPKIWAFALSTQIGRCLPNWQSKLRLKPVKKS